MNTELRTSIIRYWEKRRIFYNLALVPPALVGYGLYSGVSRGVGDQRHASGLEVLLLLGVAILGANICYSFCYALEFFLANQDPKSVWLHWRKAVLVAGILFGMLLALIGGRNIAAFQYSP